MGSEKRDTGGGSKLHKTPGPGEYTPASAGLYSAPAHGMGKAKRNTSAMMGESTPGPGQYFDTKPGEAHSEITRFGGRMLASASNEFARVHGRGLRHSQSDASFHSMDGLGASLEAPTRKPPESTFKPIPAESPL